MFRKVRIRKAFLLRYQYLPFINFTAAKVAFILAFNKKVFFKKLDFTMLDPDSNPVGDFNAHPCGSGSETLELIVSKAEFGSIRIAL